MLTIDIDVTALKAVNERIDTMVAAIEQLRSHDLATELGAWEVGDLNRRRAYVKRRRNGGSTNVRQHSWYETKGRKRFARKLIRKGRYVPRWSTRPVLRPSLLDQLSDRVAALAEASLHW
jgi:hypothetical protein